MKVLGYAFFGLIFFAALLRVLPYSNNRVAERRLESLWEKKGAQLQEVLGNQCREVRAENKSSFEKIFLNQLSNLQPGPEIQPQNLPDCLLRVASSSVSNFSLVERWAIRYEIQIPNQLPIQESYSFTTPKPLVFWPIGLLVFLLFAGASLNWLLISVGMYVLFLNGLNLVQLPSLIWDIYLQVSKSDQTAFALVGIFFWLATYLTKPKLPSKDEIEKSLSQMVLNRSLYWTVGFWSPLLYTVLGRIVFPLKRHWIAFFLETQVLVTSLSLYFLSTGFGSLYERLSSSLLLPRYFTFTLLFFFLIEQALAPEKKLQLLWQIPNLLRLGLVFLLLESLTLLMPYTPLGTPLVRLGFACGLTPLFEYKQIQWRKTLPLYLKFLAIGFVPPLLGLMSTKLGVLELVLVLLNPYAHPSFLVLFTFLVGITLGFLTGNLASIYFTLSLFMKTDTTLVSAAILDGIVVGCLISPFSLFNLLPSLSFNLRLREVLKNRWEQLHFPLLLGGSIYAIGTIQSVAVLRPVSFLFGGMVYFAYRLRKSHWIIRREVA